MTSRNTWKNFSRPAVYLSGGITRNPQGLYNRSCPSISETMFLDLEFTRKPRVSDKTHVSTSQRWQWLTGKCIQQNRCFKLQGLIKPVVFKKSEDFISGPPNQNREWLCHCCLKRDTVTRFFIERYENFSFAIFGELFFPSLYTAYRQRFKFKISGNLISVQFREYLTVQQRKI